MHGMLSLSNVLDLPMHCYLRDSLMQPSCFMRCYISYEISASWPYGAAKAAMPVQNGTATIRTNARELDEVF